MPTTGEMAARWARFKRVRVSCTLGCCVYPGILDTRTGRYSKFNTAETRGAYLEGLVLGTRFWHEETWFQPRDWNVALDAELASPEA